MDDIFLLPSHPGITSTDPLSVCNADDSFPTAWAVFTASVDSFRSANLFTLHQLPNLIEDLAYSLHLNGHADTKFLRQFLYDTYPNPNSPLPVLLLNEILDSALALPLLFPSHEIIYLSTQQPLLNFSGAQIRSLVAHQLLGTLKLPRGNTWGSTLLCWYSEPQPLEHAVHGYLETVFHFFQARQTDSRPVLYEFCSAASRLSNEGPHSWQTCHSPLFKHLIIEPIGASTVPFPHDTLTCTLISSNTSPGFGPGGTQEELVTGACPALLPLGALCVSPPVPPNAAILARGVAPASAWRGQGRDARLVSLLRGETRHMFLLLDALELDLASSPTEPAVLPDLIPHNLLRELHKAFIGFSALPPRGITNIAAPLWGTSAFCGDPIVKSLIMAMAAARAGVTVCLAVDQARSYAHPKSAFGNDNGPDSRNVLQVLQNLKEKSGDMTVGEAWDHLAGDKVWTCADGCDVARMFAAT
jgi:poly(ADP-ribose) glycohydrolase